jgi:hypothetical protein
MATESIRGHDGIRRLESPPIGCSRGGFTPEQTARYTKKIREKIAQGLSVTARGA